MSWLFVSAMLVFITACTEEKTGGAVDVRWDREVCERCRMAVSDRHYSAQVRGGLAQNHQVFKFDDIGCAVVWLDQQSWKDREDVEIWVNEQEGGKWIDARTARYSIDNYTPMGYGLGAKTSTDSSLLDFRKAVAHIYQVEKKYNIHNGEAHSSPVAVEANQ